MTNSDFRAPHPTRREFLRNVCVGAGAAALAGGLNLGQSALASPPPVRNGKPYMKLSLAAYSLNRYLPHNWPEQRESQPTMTLDDFVDYCAELNLDGCEPTSYYFPREVNHEYLMQLKERAFRLGLDISGTAIGNDFCVPLGEARDRELAMTRQWIDFAATMGAPVIRIFAGTIPKDDSEDAARERCISAINEALDYAATKGLVLALENHGGITYDADALLKIVDGVKPSPWFGVNFDSGNFNTADPYADLARIAPYAVNAQVKTEISPNGKKQPADLARIVGILREANYRGYVVLEYEAMEEPRAAIVRHINTLRELIRS